MLPTETEVNGLQLLYSLVAPLRYLSSYQGQASAELNRYILLRPYQKSGYIIVEYATLIRMHSH